MTRFEPDPQALEKLEDAVVVLTGGATGIGAATVRLLHGAGAKVVFGDVNDTAAEALVAGLSTTSTAAAVTSSSKCTTTTPIYVRCDVTKYDDNLVLVKTAFQKYGRIDHAVANAGVQERPGWFETSLTLDDVEKEPDTVVLDVNLKGVLYFARIACVYLANSGPSRDRSLTLLSSVAGFEESPGLFVYQASKHGVLGLMRALRLYAPRAFGVRVNAVCPWMTLTGMVSGISKGWLDAGLPTNTPEDVAEIVGGLVSAGPGMAKGMFETEVSEGQSGKGLDGAFNASGCQWDDELHEHGANGRAIYVEGGKGWDIEEGLAYTQSFWLGKGPCGRLVEGQQVLGEGSNWTK